MGTPFYSIALIVAIAPPAFPTPPASSAILEAIMAPPSDDLLFGVSYDDHRVDSLRLMLNAAAIPYKSSATKRNLISCLKPFETALGTEAQKTIEQAVEGHYKPTRKTARSSKQLQTAFETVRLSRDQDNKDQGEEAKKNKKRKHKQISQETRKSKVEAKVPSSQECQVCYEDLPIVSFPTRAYTTACNHERGVCVDCLGRSIAVQVDLGQFRFITCPMCPQVLELADVRRLSSRETFERYEMASLCSLSNNI
jgi:hypothetical protein